VVTLGKAVAGLAIAASVTAVAIFNFPSPSNEAASVARTASSNIVTVAEPRTPTVNPLNTYLAEHAKIAPSAGMGNMAPYVRTVNHDNQQ
jgi:hypothetical protein